MEGFKWWGTEVYKQVCCAFFAHLVYTDKIYRAAITWRAHTGTSPRGVSSDPVLGDFG
jgi:hypothetical protein